jgi:hypothetical protein
VSPLSDRGVPLEEISRLVRHSGTAVTEQVYRKRSSKDPQQRQRALTDPVKAL